MEELAGTTDAIDAISAEELPLNLCDYMVYRHVREGRGDSPALLYKDSQLTYSQTSDLVSRSAAVLWAQGVRPGDRVLLLLPDTPAFVALFFGILQVGGIVVPLNPGLDGEEVRHISVHVEAKLAFVDETLRGKFSGLEAAGMSVITVGDCIGRHAAFEQQAEQLAASRNGARLQVERAPEAVAYILFSSGTTGAPKGIPHLHTDIIHCIKAYSLPVLNMSASDRVLAVPKLTFGYGLGGNLLSAFYVGGVSILVPEPSSRESIGEAAARYSPTLFLGQPRLISNLLDGHFPEAFHGLRVAVSAGEVLAPALYQRWRAKLDVELLDGFGSTEIGHVFISNRIGDVRYGCAGRVLDGFEVKILDDTGAEVGPNTVGHLWIRGSSLASGYWNDPERTRQHFRDGWARTGDLFQYDEDGYYYATGRSDDMIKAGCGQWIAPTEVEGLLMEDEAVSDCAVVGFADNDGVVRPKAFIVLRSGLRPSLDIEERLKRMVAERWPDLSHKQLGAVEFASSLPRSSTGKLQRFRLRPATLTEFSYEC
jgi:benzoate-CoA ligase family protein